MQIIKPPTNFLARGWETIVFLAGSIEMGSAAKWQDRFADRFKGENGVLFLNPRRDDWDSSWVQSIENPQFRAQVDWEILGLEASDAIIFYFDPKTKSPISLLELGLVAGRACNNLKSHLPFVRVVCPKGFWRKGNVDIVCETYRLVTRDTLDEAAHDLAAWFKREIEW